MHINVISFKHTKKSSFPSANFHETCTFSTALHAELSYQILPHMSTYVESMDRSWFTFLSLHWFSQVLDGTTWLFPIPNQTINMESTGRNHLHPLVSMAITKLIFMKHKLVWQFSVQNSYTKFCTNLNNDSAAVSGLDIFLSSLSLYSRIHWRHEFSLYTSKLRPHIPIFSWYPTNVNIYKQLKYLIRKSLNGFSSSAVGTCDHQHKIESTWSRTLHFHATKLSSEQMCIDPMPDNPGNYMFCGGA